MSQDYGLIKNLIYRCRVHPPPGVLMIEEAEVMPLAAYAASMVWRQATVTELADQIRAGNMQFYGIKVWVR